MLFITYIIPDIPLSTKMLTTAGNHPSSEPQQLMPRWLQCWCVAMHIVFQCLINLRP